MNNEIEELVKVAKAALQYIDAIPKEVADAFPTMPGFDRDWAEEVISSAPMAYQQLAAENVALKDAFHPSDIPSEWTDVFGDTAVIEHDAAGDNQGSSISWSWVDNQEEVIKSVLLAVDKGIKTPATDRIVAGIKADGVSEFIASLPSYGDTEVDTYADGVKAAIETTQTVYGPVFIKQLREGADK